jgi:cytochrome c peroxidase
LLAACSASNDDELTPEQQAEIAAISKDFPSKAPPDTTNKYADNPDAATLGQKWFFEKRFSGAIFIAADATNHGLGAANDTNKVSCASCHDSSNWFYDDRTQPPQTSLGVGYDIRNSPTLVNAQFYKWTENDGVVDMEWADGIFAIELPWVMGGSRLQLAHAINDFYKDDYNKVFTDTPLDAGLTDMMRFPATGMPKNPFDPKAPDGDWEKMAPADRDIVNRIYANFGKATGAYVRLLISGNAPIDKYNAGDKTALSASAVRGLNLFVGKANCVACHKGNFLHDDKFHNTGYTPDLNQAHIDDKTGIPSGDPMAPFVTPHTETGRWDAVQLLLATAFLTVNGEFTSTSKYSDDTAAGTQKQADIADAMKMPPDTDIGKWRTKGLRSIDKTAPYFHNGQFATLLDLVKFYNDGGGQTASPDGTPDKIKAAAGGGYAMPTAPGFLGTKDDAMKKLNLSDAEMNDIVEFLKSLTGDPVPAALTMDTSNK